MSTTSSEPLGYTLKEVWDSFKDLENSYASGRMDSCSNYITIRLVTLIEQFCRVAYKHRNLAYNWKQTQPVAMPILVDVFQRFSPGINRSQYA